MDGESAWRSDGALSGTTNTQSACASRLAGDPHDLPHWLRLGQAVPYNPANLRNGPISGGAMVAAAGPAANLIAAAAIGFLARNLISLARYDCWHHFCGNRNYPPNRGADKYRLGGIQHHPHPPLDGYRILLRFLPPNIVPSISWLERQGRSCCSLSSS